MNYYLKLFFSGEQSLAEKRLNQSHMIAGLIIHLSLSYFRCLRGKYLDSTRSKGVFACQCCRCSTWPDQMGNGDSVSAYILWSGVKTNTPPLHSRRQPSCKHCPKKKKKAHSLLFGYFRCWLFCCGSRREINLTKGTVCGLGSK